MSFRSRSRSTAQPVPAPRRRSLSSSRTPSSSGAGYNYNGSSYNGASNSYTSLARPLSTGYYQNSTAGSGSSYYQSPYASVYSSRDNLYSAGPSRSGKSCGYLSNGNSNRNSASHASTAPTSSSSSYATSYIACSNAKAYASYSNHYSSNYAHNSSSSTAYGAGGESRYTSSPYLGDRYVNPYSSSYDNGVTTASLNFSMGAGAKGCGSSKSTSNSFKGSNSYLNKGGTSASSIPTSSVARPTASLFKSKSLSTSNSSLNAAYATPSSRQLACTNAAATAAIVARSNSLREQERKSRNRTRSHSVAQRSLSASSDKSEGYESGNERSSRSRIGSTASSTTADNNRSRVRSENGGELIDYKALWEAAKLENEKLKQLLKKKDDEVVQSKATLERFTNATTKNSLSEIEKRERRAMERKLSEMEEELKQLEVFKTENQRLKEENGALIRVISKLSK